ncbi:YggT family protein [Sphingomonas turrisvirgatae]|uniref:Osmotic-shock protein n=1 Tax=Sphingomonas turrisvirgatae TaxID=1888892 RepID=A0A1E3LWS8_9SPHN|nr:YggT family protein [Sphingomonas turrisvirgatae]ODP38186.1 osmotic-shock protein [Sphingomonas turrisvirgatae]
MILFIQILQVLIDVVWWIIIAQFILSILIAFNVINTYNSFIASLWQGLERLTEPVYRPIRRILPDTKPLDLAPMVVIIGLMILDRAIIPAIYRASIGGPI